MKRFSVQMIVLAVITSFGSAYAATSRATVYSNAPWIMDISGGMIVGGGEAAPGVDVQVAGNLKTDFPIYLGAEVGLFFTTGRYSSAAVIPMLAKIYTPIALTNAATFRVGGSMGPVIATNGSYNGAGFALLIDPVLVLNIGRTVDLAMQARFGVMGGSFVVMPEFGLTFAI